MHPDTLAAIIILGPGDICEPFGPIYPSFNLEKHRRAASKAGSLAAMTVEARRSYGAAVLEKIAALNESRAVKAPPQPSPCASGMWDSDGASILKAVRRQQIARLSESDYPRDFDGQRKWLKRQQACYEAAIAEKRARMELEALVA